MSMCKLFNEKDIFNGKISRNSEIFVFYLIFFFMLGGLISVSSSTLS